MHLGMSLAGKDRRRAKLSSKSDLHSAPKHISAMLG